MARGNHRAPSGGHSKWLIVMLVVGMFMALAPVAAWGSAFDTYTDASGFIAATDATQIAWPADADTALTQYPWSTLTGYSCEHGSFTMAGGSVTVTNPSGNWICFIDEDWSGDLSNTNPHPTGPTIVNNGEDDFDVSLSFRYPKQAVGFGLLTNRDADETVTVHFTDGTSQVLDDSLLDTAANSFEFIGFRSEKPIIGVDIDTTGGASQNEGITGMWTSDFFLPPTYEEDCASGEFFVDSHGNGANTPVVTAPLIDGALYEIGVRGTYYAGGSGLYDIQADAEYSQDRYQRTNDLPWSDFVHKYESYGEALLELEVGVGGAPAPVEWGDYNAAHEYSIQMVGSGDPLEFGFQIYDIYAQNNTGGLCASVTYLDAPPVAADIVVSTDDQTPKGVTLSATDPDGDAVTYVVDTQPTHGTLTGTAPNLTYTPNPGYSGDDTFTYHANDGTMDSNVATATIHVDLRPSGVIIEPVEGSVHTIGDPLALEAEYYDDNPGSVVYWAVRVDKNTSCSNVGTNQVWGNVDGDSDPYSWDSIASPAPGMRFTSTANTTEWLPGDYCFAFNPGAGDKTPSGEYNVRLVRRFTMNAPPVADANGPYTVDEGQSVTLDGSGSVDPEAGTLTYAWDLDNDGQYDDATGVAPTFGPLDDGPALYTIGLKVTDQYGATDTDTTTVTVNNVAPTATFGSDGEVNEGSAFMLKLTGPSDPSNADTAAGFEYAFDCGSGYGAFSATSSLSCPTTDDGTIPVKGKIRDKDNGVTEYTDTVTVNNVAPVVTVDISSQDVQYSDGILPVTITATDVAADTMTATAIWLPSGLSLSPASCGDSDGVKTCTWTVTGDVGDPEGTYTATITVVDKDGGSTKVSTTFVVTPEDATVAFDPDNPVAVPVTDPGENSGSFTLNVTVTETQPDLADGTPAAGDIGLAAVSMKLVPVGGGSPVDGTCTPEPVTGSGYDAELPVSCSFDSVPVNTYTVDVDITGGYYTGSNEDVLVVYDPSLGFTTGGGWFYWPGTDEKTNFGYTMKYNKKGTKVQGSFLLIRHLADGTKYRVKSNALYGLALGSDDGLGWASFSGKATYLEPGWDDAMGNHEFVVYVEDHGEPGVADVIWLETHDKNGDVIGALSMLRPANENGVKLDGGNIVVPH